MEPDDFDKLIKDRVSGENTIHSKELTEAKPFVWASVQSNLKSGNALKWYHLAAAILLLLISFAFLLVGIQKTHMEEIALVSSKLDGLEEFYQSQEKLLNIKDQQVADLASELRKVEIKLSSMEQIKPNERKEVIIYRKDTVYIKRTEYVRVKEQPSLVENNNGAPVIQANNVQEDAASVSAKFDQIIYPSFEEERTRQKSESVKLKFGNARAIRN